MERLFLNFYIFNKVIVHVYYIVRCNQQQHKISDDQHNISYSLMLIETHIRRYAPALSAEALEQLAQLLYIVV